MAPCGTQTRTRKSEHVVKTPWKKRSGSSNASNLRRQYHDNSVRRSWPPKGPIFVARRLLPNYNPQPRYLPIPKKGHFPSTVISGTYENRRFVQRFVLNGFAVGWWGDSLLKDGLSFACVGLILTQYCSAMG